MSSTSAVTGFEQPLRHQTRPTRDHPPPSSLPQSLLSPPPSPPSISLNHPETPKHKP